MRQMRPGWRLASGALRQTATCRGPLTLGPINLSGVQPYTPRNPRIPCRSQDPFCTRPALLPPASTSASASVSDSVSPSS